MRTLLVLAALCSFPGIAQLPLGGITATSSGSGGITQVGTCTGASCIGGNTQTGVAGGSHQTATTGNLTIPSGTTLLVGVCYGVISSWTVSDTSSANTWNSAGVPTSLAIYYAYAPATGTYGLVCNSGSTSGFPSAVLTAWSGTLTTSSVLDQYSAVTTSVATCPQLTHTSATFATTQNNELVVCASAAAQGTTYTISGSQSYSVIGYNGFSAGTNYGSGLAGVVQTTAGNIGTGTWAGSSSFVNTLVASFLHP